MNQLKERKIKKVCSICGSEDIRMDAWAMWNYDKQKWEIEDVFDSCWCESCGGGCNVEDKEN